MDGLWQDLEKQQIVEGISPRRVIMRDGARKWSLTSWIETLTIRTSVTFTVNSAHFTEQRRMPITMC